MHHDGRAFGPFLWYNRSDDSNYVQPINKERMSLLSIHSQLVWRHLAVQDLDAWLDLLHAAYARNLEAGMNFTAATMARPQGEGILTDHHVWGGSAGSELVATFTLRHDEEGWHVNSLGVQPRHSRLGYGSLALAEAELQARQLGAATLLLDTAEVHPWLLTFYERRGYVAYDHRQWSGKTYRSVLFEKHLS